jgi:hypothetical protein
MAGNGETDRHAIAVAACIGAALAASRALKRRCISAVEAGSPTGISTVCRTTRGQNTEDERIKHDPPPLHHARH